MKPTKAIYINDIDGFIGTVVGFYTTREGEQGIVLQQINTKVIHVYRQKYLRLYGARNDDQET